MISFIFGCFLLNGCVVQNSIDNISNVNSITENGTLDKPLDNYVDIENNPNIMIDMVMIILV